ncbi:UNVERIFIED_CONTAM: hypothetical protein K2H54_037690 [Gekko kuhli]
MPGFVALPPVPPRGPRGRPSSERLPGLECVLLGDGAVGKTSLALSYSANGFPARYLPTALDRYSAVVEVDGAPLRLQLCDTAGQEASAGLRRLCYGRAEVFLLCFSVVAPASFASLSARWLPELRRHCPAAPVLLVGTQADLRHDARVLLALARRRQRPVPAAAARALAARLGAAAYVECSALTQQRLKEVFDTAIAAALRRRAQPPEPKARPAARLRTLSKAWWSKYGCLRP